MMLFKTLILTGVLMPSADVAFACCDSLHVFDVRGAVLTDVLNSQQTRRSLTL